MDKRTFALLEGHMRRWMGDSAHDVLHVYRVLYLALEIARTEEGVDRDVLIAACLLHDIGRQAQFQDPSVCHAEAGGDLAFQFLEEQGFGQAFARQVRACIRTHRYRSDRPPERIEAKILFDADKLDVTGAMGIARTLLYQGRLGLPLYALTPEGGVSDGSRDRDATFFQEYRRKLEKLYDRFYTAAARDMALQRRRAAQDFCQALYREAAQAHQTGCQALEEALG